MKIVLATNVAETSITIDDVGFVIDSGRVKEERYEPERRMASLEDVLVSRAAAKQRRGRAGRVQPGLCVHLYPSDVRQASYTEPEVRRVALEQLVMRTKALRLRGLGGNRAADIASRLPEPPDMEAVDAAVQELKSLGALERTTEGLTDLGKLLAKLPIDARLGKLIILGLCFGAADECLTVAAALASRSPFMSPLERREQADESRRSFGASLQSDHLAVLFAYQQFDSREGQSRFDFARERFLSIRTLQSIAQLKRQLLEVLSTAGLVMSGLRAGNIEMEGRYYGRGSDGVRYVLRQHSAAEPVLLYGILCAALFPQVAYLHAPMTKKGPCSSDMIRLHIREPKGDSFEPQVAAIHPSSINSKATGGDWNTAYVSFHECVRTTKIYVRDCTPAPPLALVLFCGAEVVEETPTPGVPYSCLVVDGCFHLEVPAGAVPSLLEMRRRLARIFQRMVEKPDGSGGGEDALPLTDAVVELLRQVSLLALEGSWLLCGVVAP